MWSLKLTSTQLEAKKVLGWNDMKKKIWFEKYRCKATFSPFRLKISQRIGISFVWPSTFYSSLENAEKCDCIDFQFTSSLLMSHFLCDEEFMTKNGIIQGEFTNSYCTNLMTWKSNIWYYDNIHHLTYLEYFKQYSSLCVYFNIGTW